MSWNPALEPESGPCSSAAEVRAVIKARAKDIGALSVGRVLPSLALKNIGPFLFFDHIGPAEFPPGQGVNVRPHPHINLATLTYLFEGEIDHRDSLGCYQPIRPGEVNWMIAGRGVVHSERSSPAQRAARTRLHGIQVWVGLPSAAEEMEPSFTHFASVDVPAIELPGVQLRVVAGDAYGGKSPVQILSPLFYVDAQLEAGAELTVPDGYRERAAYVATGEVTCGAHTSAAQEMLVLEPGCSVALKATRETRLILLGGEPLDGPRMLWWNFVYRDPARLERAKQDWQNGLFPKVAGDETEFIPLPIS